MTIYDNDKKSLKINQNPAKSINIDQPKSTPIHLNPISSTQIETNRLKSTTKIDNGADHFLLHSKGVAGVAAGVVNPATPCCRVKIHRIEILSFQLTI